MEDKKFTEKRLNELRKELESMISSAESLSRDAIMDLSRKLDIVIVEFIKLDENK